MIHISCFGSSRHELRNVVPALFESWLQDFADVSDRCGCQNRFRVGFAVMVTIFISPAADDWPILCFRSTLRQFEPCLQDVARWNLAAKNPFIIIGGGKRIRIQSICSEKFCE